MMAQCWRVAGITAQEEVDLRWPERLQLEAKRREEILPPRLLKI